MAKVVIFFLIFFIIFFIAFIYFMSHNYKIKYDNFTFFEGSLGSGKTTIITNKSLNELFKRKLYNLFVANKVNNFLLTIFLYICPIANIIALIISLKRKKLFRLNIKKRGTELYSDYPIKYKKHILWGKWIYSKVCDITLFNWLVKYDEDCICSLDELGYWFPPNTNTKGIPIMTDKLTIFGITWLRHAISPCVFCASQSIDEVNITFRRKIQHIYRLSNNTKVFGRLSKLNVREIQRSEDSGSIITTFNDSDKNHLENYHYYWYPKKNFASRYAKLLYKLDKVDTDAIANNYEALLSLLNLKPGDYWRGLYFFQDD